MALRKSHITTSDFQEVLRQEGRKPDVTLIDAAYLERDGGISIILKR